MTVGNTLTITLGGREIGEEIAGLIKSGKMMICTPDENQLMLDYTTLWFCLS